MQKTKARFSCVLRHPVLKQRGPILVSVLHKFVTYLLRYPLTSEVLDTERRTVCEAIIHFACDCQIFTDIKNSFTSKLGNNLAVKWPNNSPHLKYATTLPVICHYLQYMFQTVASFLTLTFHKVM